MCSEQNKIKKKWKERNETKRNEMMKKYKLMMKKKLTSESRIRRNVDCTDTSLLRLNE